MYNLRVLVAFLLLTYLQSRMGKRERGRRNGGGGGTEGKRLQPACRCICINSEDPPHPTPLVHLPLLAVLKLKTTKQAWNESAVILVRKMF
jgi:hypothetical protein